eukprot:TRINITY_DN2073_c0_g1_i1.p1 TRINITY_DN2073_c0_g1~~TRINITY_DN2073_c0_g1_i1.p1  ORF type:complete len:164 (+),score=29.77 TRINITY_DN2073_c0_g1_i1:1446-1937(+)
MARAIAESSGANMFQLWQACYCLDQPQCGTPHRRLHDRREFVSYGNKEDDYKQREVHNAQHRQLLDSMVHKSRWRSRDVLQREYHDAFKANNPMLYEAFITEQGMYTAEAVQHFMCAHKAQTAMLVVGVAHQSAVEQHLCNAHGYAMSMPTRSQLIKDAHFAA